MLNLLFYSTMITILMCKFHLFQVQSIKISWKLGFSFLTKNELESFAFKAFVKARN